MLAGLLLLLSTAACGGEVGSALAEGNAGDKFPGEINFIVPYTAGGGYDVIARVILPYLEKNLPDGTNITVRNMSGANGVAGIQEVMSAPADGSTIGFFNLPGFALAPLAGQADYDLTKVEWVGRVSKTTYVATAAPKSGIETPDDLVALDTVKASVAGVTDTGAIGTQIALLDLGVEQNDIQLVAHEGGPEAMTAAIRGDVDFVQYSYGTIRPYIVDSQDLVPLWVYADARLEDLPDVPTFEEVRGDPSLVDIISMHRLIGTTPGTPPAILKTLREALAVAMQDPELLEQMDEGALEPDYADADEAAGITDNSLALMANYTSLFE